MPLASLHSRFTRFDDERLNQKIKIATLKNSSVRREEWSCATGEPRATSHRARSATSIALTANLLSWGKCNITNIGRRFCPHHYTHVYSLPGSCCSALIQVARAFCSEHVCTIMVGRIGLCFLHSQYPRSFFYTVFYTDHVRGWVFSIFEPSCLGFYPTFLCFAFFREDEMTRHLNWWTPRLMALLIGGRGRLPPL